MQAVEKLALESPLELRVVEVARVHIEVVSMHRNGAVLELNNQLHTLAFGARREVHQGVLVEAQLRADSFQARVPVFGHGMILAKPGCTCLDASLRPRTVRWNTGFHTGIQATRAAVTHSAVIVRFTLESSVRVVSQIAALLEGLSQPLS